MFELIITGVSCDDEDDISNILEEEGAVAITLKDAADQPILEPGPGETPLWSEIEIQALFEEAAQAARATKVIQANYTAVNCLSSILADQDWERAWQVQAKPLCFGKRLWVCPSITQPPDPTAVNIILDPGLAFGTGTHPTTALCLRWLDAHDIAGKTLVDYGCGSGILSIAALKLGAAAVYAIDIDAQALHATKQNAIQNELDLEKLHIDELPKLPVDVIMANILLNPLIALKQTFHTLLKPDGRLVISGILKEQMLVLQSAYADLFGLQEVEELEDWAALAFTCVGPRPEPKLR